MKAGFYYVQYNTVRCRRGSDRVCRVPAHFKAPVISVSLSVKLEISKPAVSAITIPMAVVTIWLNSSIMVSVAVQVASVYVMLSAGF